MSGLQSPLLPRPLLSTIILLVVGSATLLAGACVDPEGEFKNFDTRVLDAGMPAVGTGCMGGEIPAVDGEFFLNLDTSLAPGAFLKFIFTQTIDKNVNPAVLSMSLQPLCSQDSQCTVNQPIGDAVVLDDTNVNENCDFTLDIVDVFIPGGANSLSGSDLVGNLQMRGNLQTVDFVCGAVDGEAMVGSANINVDNSTFGSVRNTAVGALGDDLPEAVGTCPPAP